MNSNKVDLRGASRTGVANTMIGNLDIPLASDKWSDLLHAFVAKYGFRIPIENQPADHTLVLIVKMRARRAADFVSLARIVNAIDCRSPNTEPARLSKSSPILIDADMVSLGKKASGFIAPPE